MKYGPVCRMGLILSGILIVPLIIVSIVSAELTAIASSNSCSDVNIVFARGSGQETGDKAKESKRPQTFAFYNSITDRLPENVSHELIELDYPAAGVGDKGIRNTIEAEWSWLGRLFGGEFNQSVESGVEELKHQLQQIEDQCENNLNHRIILGGYSQGANVVGNTLHELDGDYADKIMYAGMFGDPKFDGSSYAARGAVKNNDNQPTYGVLETRDGELPKEYRGRIDSWCRKGDGVCESSYRNTLFYQSTHSDAYQHHEIPLAAQRAAALLQEEFSHLVFNTRKPEIDTSPHGKLDLMFVVNGQYFNTIRRDITSLRHYREAIVEQAKILSPDLRVGLVGYHRHTILGSSFTYQKLAKVNHDSEPLSALENKFNYGKDSIPNAALQKALSEDWRPDAKKMIITTANLRDVDEEGGNTYDAVLNNAEAQGVSLFSVTPRRLRTPEDRAAYYQLYDTGGLPFWRNKSTTVNAGAMAESMLATMAADRSIYNGQPYKATPEDEVHFNLTGWYGQPAEDLKYEWRFTGGFSFSSLDEVTSTPVASYTYGGEFSGLARVKVYHNERLINQLMIPVEISNSHIPPKTPAPPENIEMEILDQNFAYNPSRSLAVISLTTSNEPVHTIRIRWDEAIGASEGYAIRHTDGSLLGITKPGRTSQIITDVPADKIDGLQVASLGSVAASTSVAPQQITDKTEQVSESPEDDATESNQDLARADDQEINDDYSEIVSRSDNKEENIEHTKKQADSIVPINESESEYKQRVKADRDTQPIKQADKSISTTWLIVSALTGSAFIIGVVSLIFYRKPNV